jgi:HSP20 family protein
MWASNREFVFILEDGGSSVKQHLFEQSHWNQLARQLLGDDFFDEMAAVAKSHEPSLDSYPNADVYHGKNEVIVVVELPGMEDINSLDLHVEGDTLLLKGYSPNPYQSYQISHTERVRGTFQKKIPLGVVVSPKYTHARYRKGILEIRFPKLNQRNAHRVDIHSVD